MPARLRRAGRAREVSPHRIRRLLALAARADVRLTRLLRAGFAIVDIVAIGAQLSISFGHSAFKLENFLSYFTIQSNLFAALILLAGALSAGRSRTLEIARGAATLCMALVGIAFSLLLAREESELMPWVNAVVHYILPVVMVLDWSIDPPRTKITLREMLVWLCLPFAYLVYTLIRGSVVHWYPYPFLDVERAGAGAVAAYAAGLIVVTSLLAALLRTRHRLQA